MLGSARRRMVWLLPAVAMAVYGALFLNGWWNQGKGHYPNGSEATGSVSQAQCTAKDLQPFTVPSTSPHHRRDARPWLLEFHPSDLLYADILSQRPDCIAELLAHRRRDARQHVTLLLDRITGEPVARFAFLGGTLGR